MKIKIKVAHKLGPLSLEVGDNIIVTNDVGRDLIGQGIAVSKEFVSLDDKIAEKVSKEKADQLREELPRKAVDQVKFIKTISNQVFLTELTGSELKSVRTAALRRLEEI